MEWKTNKGKYINLLKKKKKEKEKRKIHKNYFLLNKIEKEI